MSATTELLTLKLNEVEDQLSEAHKRGDNAEIKRLTTERDRVRAQLLTASKQLSEGVQLLKG